MVVMRFDQSLRETAVGAPVDLRGIALEAGVTSIGIEYNEHARNFSMKVTMALYPSRLSRRSDIALPAPDTAGGHELLEQWSCRGCAGNCAPAAC